MANKDAYPAVDYAVVKQELHNGIEAKIVWADGRAMPLILETFEGHSTSTDIPYKLVHSLHKHARIGKPLQEAEALFAKAYTSYLFAKYGPAAADIGRQPCIDAYRRGEKYVVDVYIHSDDGIYMLRRAFDTKELAYTAIPFVYSEFSNQFLTRIGASYDS